MTENNLTTAKPMVEQSEFYDQAILAEKIITEKVNEANIHLLKGLSYVFICIDSNSARCMIISQLKEFGVTFIDVGL